MYLDALSLCSHCVRTPRNLFVAAQEAKFGHLSTQRAAEELQKYAVMETLLNHLQY